MIIEIIEIVLGIAKNSLDFSIVLHFVTFAEDLPHQWPVTNSNGSSISPNSSKMDQMS